MAELRDLDLADVVLAAERALSSAAGVAVTLRDVHVLSEAQRRNLVFRACADHDGGTTRAVVVKAARAVANPDAPQDSGLVREWAATSYLAERAAGVGHGAALLAGAAREGLLVFEDLGADLGSLVGPLLNGGAADAERALTAYARALGRLHADTAACRQAYDETFQSFLSVPRADRSVENPVERQARSVAAQLGGDPPADELAQIARRLRDPGPWLALVHGDPCPDNALVVGDRVHLIDYEFAGPSHALLDGAYWRMGFPTCWCAGRLPPEVAMRVEAVYRAEIARTMPQAADEGTYRAELAFAAAIWLFVCLDWRLEEALREDAQWGVASVRSRLLLYLETVVDLAGAAGVLPEIRRTAEVWLRDLRGRWPQTEALALYPAFAASSAVER